MLPPSVHCRLPHGLYSHIYGPIYWLSLVPLLHTVLIILLPPSGFGPASPDIRAAFWVPPQKCHREIRFISLPWTQLCLKNGSLHRGPPNAINSDWLKGFFKMTASIGVCHSRIKRTILISCTVGHFRGAFCLLSKVGDACNDTRQTLNTNWAKKCCPVALESTMRHSLNATQSMRLQKSVAAWTWTCEVELNTGFPLSTPQLQTPLVYQ